jgi:hypothetical protein
MKTENKIVNVTGPEMADTLKREEAAGWRCVAVAVIGAADYELRLARTVKDHQPELLKRDES